MPKARNVHGPLRSRDIFPKFPWCYPKETLRAHHIFPVEWSHVVKQYYFAGWTHPRGCLSVLWSGAKVVQPYLCGPVCIADHGANDIVRGLAWRCNHPRLTLTEIWNFSLRHGARRQQAKRKDVSIHPCRKSRILSKFSTKPQLPFKDRTHSAV